MMLFKHYEIFCPWKPNCPITRAQKLFKYNCITTKSSKVYVATLALGSRPRQWLARARAKRKARECGRVWEWTLTFPSELPFWELESRWTFKSSKKDCKGQNPLDLEVPYIIGKFLERRCLKWVCMTHLDIWNASYGQKKGGRSNWHFDSWPLKVGNRPNFLACRWLATYCWKALDEGYNFALDLMSIESLHTKLWDPKVAGVAMLPISGLSFGSPGTKCHLDVCLMERHKVYYKGEGGGFPQVRTMMSLMSSSLPVVHLNTKNALALH